MPDLSFAVEGCEAPPFAAVPMLTFKLRIQNADKRERVLAVALRCQISLAPTRRRYNPAEQARLLEVFGEPHRWGETLRSFLWTNASTMVPQFTGSTLVSLPVPCTYDFEVVGTKYFHALEDGEAPLNFLFSGTIFYEGDGDNLQIAQISWQKEASFRMPIALWQDMMAHYYPNSAWIRLSKDVFDQLYSYKAEHALPTWEAALLELLRASGAEVRP
jgi:Family of unknown function (DUF6084)